MSKEQHENNLYELAARLGCEAEVNVPFVHTVIKAALKVIKSVPRETQIVLTDSAKQLNADIAMWYLIGWTDEQLLEQGMAKEVPVESLADSFKVYNGDEDLPEPIRDFIKSLNGAHDGLQVHVFGLTPEKGGE